MPRRAPPSRGAARRALTTFKEYPMRLPFFLHTGRTRSFVMVGAAALAAVCLILTTACSPAPGRTSAKPTIVLVHGAFADASGFGAVADRLQRRGYTVICPANPLRGPAYDA